MADDTLNPNSNNECNDVFPSTSSGAEGMRKETAPIATAPAIVDAGTTTDIIDTSFDPGLGCSYTSNTKHPKKTPKKRGCKKVSKGSNSVLAQSKSFRSLFTVPSIGGPLGSRKLKTTKELMADIQNRRYGSATSSPTLSNWFGQSRPATSCSEPSIHSPGTLDAYSTNATSMSAAVTRPPHDDVLPEKNISSTSAPGDDDSNTFDRNTWYPLRDSGATKTQLHSRCPPSQLTMLASLPAASAYTGADDCSSSSSSSTSFYSSTSSIGAEVEYVAGPTAPGSIEDKINQLKAQLPPIDYEMSNWVPDDVTPCTCEIRQFLEEEQEQDVLDVISIAPAATAVATSRSSPPPPPAAPTAPPVVPLTSIETTPTTPAEIPILPKKIKSIFDFDSDEDDVPLCSFVRAAKQVMTSSSLSSVSPPPTPAPAQLEPELSRQAPQSSTPTSSGDNGDQSHSSPLSSQQQFAYQSAAPEMPPPQFTLPKPKYIFLEDPNCAARQRYNIRPNQITESHVSALHNYFIPNVNGNWDHSAATAAATVTTATVTTATVTSAMTSNTPQALPSLSWTLSSSPSPLLSLLRAHGLWENVVPSFGSLITSERIPKDLSHITFTKNFKPKKKQQQWSTSFLGVANPNRLWRLHTDPGYDQKNQEHKETKERKQHKQHQKETTDCEKVPAGEIDVHQHQDNASMLAARTATGSPILMEPETAAVLQPTSDPQLTNNSAGADADPNDPNAEADADPNTDPYAEADTNPNSNAAFVVASIDHIEQIPPSIPIKKAADKDFHQMTDDPENNGKSVEQDSGVAAAPIEEAIEPPSVLMGEAASSPASSSTRRRSSSCSNSSLKQSQNSRRRRLEHKQKKRKFSSASASPLVKRTKGDGDAAEREIVQEMAIIAANSDDKEQINKNDGRTDEIGAYQVDEDDDYYELEGLEDYSGDSHAAGGGQHHHQLMTTTATAEQTETIIVLSSSDSSVEYIQTIKGPATDAENQPLSFHGTVPSTSSASPDELLKFHRATTTESSSHCVRRRRRHFRNRRPTPAAPCKLHHQLFFPYELRTSCESKYSLFNISSCSSSSVTDESSGDNATGGGSGRNTTLLRQPDGDGIINTGYNDRGNIEDGFVDLVSDADDGFLDNDHRANLNDNSKDDEEKKNQETSNKKNSNDPNVASCSGISWNQLPPPAPEPDANQHQRPQPEQQNLAVPGSEYRTGVRAVNEDANDEDDGRIQHFKEWYEVLQVPSYNDELLTIMPYVVLDD